ncbi:MAG: cation transporter [Gammaproteobacteria bacterium]|jgi:Co/Zn/Cd efflux system component|nr:cation transporter [Gammaproteobacteria bacterium]|tara:strand:+ start:283 stop:909 length:627 start_codon:yes stop_codon:yes gene_type:complete
MADCCESELEVAGLEASQRRVLIIVLTINLVTFVGMVFASWLSQSSALLSGTLDNLGDALTYSLSLLVVGAGVVAKARVAVFKGALIAMAAVAVAVQIGWRMYHLDVPVVAIMGVAAVVNLLANGICLYLLNDHRHDDVNMMSVWECSRNDVNEGVAVILTVGLVWFTQSALPDLLVAIGLLVMFSRSAIRVLTSAFEQLNAASRQGV